MSRRRREYNPKVGKIGSNDVVANASLFINSGTEPRKRCHANFDAPALPLCIRMDMATLRHSCHYDMLGRLEGKVEDVYGFMRLFSPISL